MASMMPRMQQGGPPQQQPPANVPSESLMALLTFLKQMGVNLNPGQPAPQGAVDASQGSMQTLLPQILHMLSQNPQQAQAPQQAQQAQQQAQQPPQILQMLAQLGLGIK